MRRIALIICLLIVFVSLFAQFDLTVEDNPNDAGDVVRLKWSTKLTGVDSVKIERSGETGPFQVIARLGSSRTEYIDSEGISTGERYRYRVSLIGTGSTILAMKGGETIPTAQWFNTEKITLLIMLLLISVSILYFILSGKSGKELYIRRIGGLDSMDESVGRATEMGKPILFVPGINDLDDIQTLAALTILGKLAQKTAEYDAKIIVPVARSMVLSTAKEIVKESYLKAGRPDAFDPDCVFYITDDQFGFVAGVDGIILREKPAANFFLGAFYAESLILAETGFTSGAIQTAGTAMPSQLPFFVVACDYTLIGEELFAASAYLSGDPHQLGSLKGQDVGKAIVVSTILLGTILEISGVHFLKIFLTSH